MIRLALMLALFVTLAAAGVAQGDPGPAPDAGVVVSQPPEQERATPEQLSEPRPRSSWAPRQARRRADYGPRVTPYQVLLAPAGISNLPF